MKSKEIPLSAEDYLRRIMKITEKEKQAPYYHSMVMTRFRAIADLCDEWAKQKRNG